MFPQGWDCHGLPTEVKVEEIHGITKNDVPREKFREMCRELTLANIGKMRLTLRRLGFSVDWSNEYITMMPGILQKDPGSPSSGCSRQAISTRANTRSISAPGARRQSHLPRSPMSGRETHLNYFDFDGVEIATTRPELLAACVAVAVHPGDERYKSIWNTS